ncbi:hypothetical protein HJC23_007510 [Cyclotella cryptica]|uniref:rhomboid protease n=1 Tax=Cyclotella cryptica TaxID=29204 RepID=A0ABD3PUN5_9STRA|eukprot:CCRYP_011412-RA/>CCRYP_011412-RA protein AED:0.08 eAED:0.08 QI:309/1/1/1/0.5/0.33/3/681/407
MSTLLAKARKSTRNMVTNRSRSSSQLKESTQPTTISEDDDEESHVGEYTLQSESTTSSKSSSQPAKRTRPQIIQRLSSRQLAKRRSTLEDFQLDPWDEDNVDAFPPELHHKQSCAPLSTLFCVAQTAILAAMMIQCGVAPMNINPMIGPYPDALNYWGAKNSVLIIDDGEFWRLITPIFLHAGVIHLFGNIMVQIESGNRWEKEWGSLIWIIIYIGSAFGSSILSAIVMPDQISVGSSGAVMGLFGGKFAEIVLLCCEKSETRVEKADERSRKEQACEVVGGIILVMAMSFIPYVDWAAHLGGLAAGFVIGLVCFSFKIRNWFFILVWFVIGVGSTVALFSGALVFMYTGVETNEDLRDVCGYYKQYFQDYECQCMLDEAIQFGSWQIGGGANNGGGGGEGDGEKFM